MELNRSSSSDKKIEGPQSPCKETTVVDIKPLLEDYYDDKKEHGDNYKYKLKRFLKFISLGQYPTPLYFQKNESYSSTIGGIITILFMVFMTYIGFNIALPIFGKENYILEGKSFKFQKFEVVKAPDNVTTFVKLDPHCSDNCQIVTNDEILDDLFNNNTSYGVIRERNVTLQKPFSQYSLELQFLTFINQSDTHYRSININSNQEIANICLFNFENVKNEMFDTKSQYLLFEPAFLERLLKDKIISRFKLVFRGLKHNEETLVSIR